MALGGKREGAGRKPVPSHIKKRPMAVKLSGWLIDWLDAQESSRASIIEAALIKVHKLKAPTVAPDDKGETGE